MVRETRRTLSWARGSRRVRVGGFADCMLSARRLQQFCRLQPALVCHRLQPVECELRLPPFSLLQQAGFIRCLSGFHQLKLVANGNRLKPARSTGAFSQWTHSTVQHNP
jgi:hypothetical protein